MRKSFRFGLYPSKAQQQVLEQRVHVCPNCGCVEDRDVNAAKNILMAPSD